MKTITKVWEDAVIAANVCKKKIVEVGMREELSVCEAPIMKIIWESNPDISVPELVKQLNEQYGKEYAVKVDSRLNEGTVVTIRIPKNASTAIERSDEQELP